MLRHLAMRSNPTDVRNHALIQKNKKAVRPKHLLRTADDVRVRHRTAMHTQKSTESVLCVNRVQVWTWLRRVCVCSVRVRVKHHKHERPQHFHEKHLEVGFVQNWRTRFLPCGTTENQCIPWRNTENHWIIIQNITFPQNSLLTQPQPLSF